MKRFALVLMLLMLSMALFAENVTIVYLDRSETNLEGGSFIKKEAKSQGVTHTFTYAFGFQALKGNERVVVILSSGRSSGLDPRVESFIASSTRKESLILVNLYSLGRDTLFATVDSVDSALGVDEISAATRWEESKGGVFSKPKPNPYFEMHQQWTSYLYTLIDEKLAQ